MALSFRWFAFEAYILKIPRWMHLTLEILINYRLNHSLFLNIYRIDISSSQPFDCLLCMIKVALIIQPLFLCRHCFKELVSVSFISLFCYNQYHTIAVPHNFWAWRQEAKLVGLQGSCGNSFAITELIACRLHLIPGYCKL